MPDGPRVAPNRAPAGGLRAALPEGLGAGLRGGGRGSLARDLQAGAVVAAMLVPQGMAYAALAGLTLEAGLYASLASLVLYGLVGPSRALSVGPVAVDSLLTAQALALLTTLRTPEAARLAGVLALLVAGLYLLGALLRAGRLAALVEGPVLLGFTHAAALVIALSQARHLARLPGSEDAAPWQAAASLGARLGDVHGPTLAVGLGALALLLLWRRAAAPLGRALGLRPGLAEALGRAGPLGAVLLGAGLSLALGLEAAGVPVVGDVPAGLPVPAVPGAAAHEVLALLPHAAVIALVGFLECTSIAGTLALRRGERLRPDAELAALAVANAGAGLVGGFPVTGGLSRSMVNHQAGAATGRASLVTAALLAAALLALSPAFHPIPRAVLAAVVLLAVLALVDPGAVRRLAREDRGGLLVALVTFAASLALDLAWGVGAGLLAALLLRGLRRAHRPVPGSRPSP